MSEEREEHEPDIWYHVGQTPDGLHVHELGTEDQVKEPVIRAIERKLGFPDDWLCVGGWASSVAPGLPHSHTMARAVLHKELPALELSAQVSAEAQTAQDADRR